MRLGARRLVGRQVRKAEAREGMMRMRVASVEARDDGRDSALEQEEKRARSSV